MIKVRINGRVKQFDTAKDYEQYLDAQKPKKKRKKKVDYKAVEEEPENDGEE